MAKTVIVVAFDQGTVEEMQTVLRDLKPTFEGKEVKVYGAMHETAETIIEVLELGADTPPPATEERVDPTS